MISFVISIQEKDALELFEISSVILFGLIVGSFLNMLIYRLPLQISLLNPKRSLCPQCKHSLPFYENIPLLSYIFLKGRCSSCQQKISFVYPFVEFLTAVVSLFLFLKIGLNLEFYFISILFYILILLSFIDLRYKAVPDYLLVLISCIMLLYLFLFHQEHIGAYFIFAGGIVILELFVTYYIQNIKSALLKDESLKEQKALGEGDIPIIALMGGLLGIELGLFALFLSAIFAIIPSLIQMISKKERETAFIPYLSLALFITFISENEIVYLIQIGALG